MSWPKDIHKAHTIVYVTDDYYTSLYNCIVLIRPVDMRKHVAFTRICNCCDGCFGDACAPKYRPDKQQVIHIKLRQY